MLVLVTGAAGHLGSATCKHLLAAGVEFRATDMSTKRDLGYRVQVANLLNREACYGLIEGCDAVVHIANRPNEHAGNPQQVFGENGVMNMNVFQAAVELGVKKIIYASSIQAIIGSRRPADVGKRPAPYPYLPADGDTPPCPGNCYAASKVAGEVLLRTFAEHRGLHSAIAIRFPGMWHRDWFDWFRKRAKAGNVWQDGYIDELFTWLSFDDAARLVGACLRAELPGYRCYFPVHPQPFIDTPIEELVAKYWANVPKKDPKTPLTGLVDISRITAETGWVPQDDFRVPAPPPPAVPPVEKQTTAKAV